MLRRALGRSTGWLILSCLLQVVCAALTVGAVAVISFALTDLVEHGRINRTSAWIFAGMVLGAVLVHAISFSVSFAVARGMEQRLRTTLAGHVARIPLGWFVDGAATARLRKALGPDMGAVSGLVGELAPMNVRFVCTGAFSLVLLIVVSPLLALPILLVVGIASALEVRRLGGRTTADLGYERAATTLAARSVELGQGITVTKVYGSTTSAGRRFNTAVDDFAAAYVERDTAQERRGLLSSALASWNSILGIVVVAGTVLIWAGLISPTDMIVFLLLSWTVSRSVYAVPTALMFWRRANLVVAAMNEIMAVPDLPVADDPERLPAPPVDVEFANVTFGYGAPSTGRAVLTDLSLRVPAGTTTALVGSSGSGKSTAVRLLPRFFDPAGGRIRVGGVDIRDLAPEDLYRTVGFVFQDVQLLRRSIAQNIALARPDAPMAEIENAARSAQIHDRILRLPRGYDSVIGEDAELSGGEAQRVSIARVLLADAPVVVLDEPTSAADPESEAAVLRAVARLMRGRTVLTIAHRLATITAADEIVVLHQGRIVESGTHAELWARGGRYAQMYAREQAGSGRIDPTAADGVTPC